MSNKKNNIQYDEWGDPIGKVPAPKEPTVLDEWNDPVKYLRVNKDEYKEHMSEQDKLRLEKELVDRGLIYPRAHYLPKGRLRGIVALLLAFFFGIFIIFGAVIGAGVAASVTPMDKIFSLFKWDPEQYNEYLAAEYTKLSVTDFVKSLADKEFNSLDDLAEISPYVANLIDDLFDEEGKGVFDSGFTLSKYGIKVDKAALMTTDFKDLGKYITDTVVKDIELGGLLTGVGVDMSDPILRALCFGEEGVDYTVDAEGKIVMNTDKTPLTLGTIMDDPTGMLDNVRLGTLLEVNKDSEAILLALCYGEKDVDYTIDENGKIVMNEGRTALTVGDLMKTDEDGKNGFLARLDTVGLGTVLEVGPESDAILLALCYGEKGVNYDIIDGKIVMKKGYTALSVGELMNGDTVMDRLNDIRLATLLNPGDDPILLALCYGKEGVDYTVNADGSITPITDPLTLGELTSGELDMMKRIEPIDLGTLLGVTSKSDPVLIALCYGEKGEDKDYTVTDDGKIVMNEGKTALTVGDLTGEGNALSDTIGKMKIGTLLNIDPTAEGTSDLMKALADKTVNDLNEEETLNSLTIGELTGTDASAKGILGQIYSWTIADLKEPDMIDTLNIGKLLDVDLDDPGTSALMKALSKKTVGQLKTGGVDDLTIGDLTGAGASSKGILGAIHEWTVKDLNDETKFNNLQIGVLVGADESTTGILGAIRNWTIQDLKDGNKIDDLEIGVLIGAGATTGLMAAIAGWTVGDLKEGNKVETLKISDIVGTEVKGGFMSAIADWTVADLKNEHRINRLRIGDVLGMEDATSGFMASIKDWRLEDLSSESKINSLTLGSVMTIDTDAPQILRALQDTPIGGLAHRMDTLRLSEIMDVEGNNILKHLANSTLGSLSDDLQALTIGQVFADDIYSYLDTSAGGKSYKQMHDYYFGLNTDGTDNTDKYRYTLEKFNKNDTYRPTAYKFQENETVVTYYYDTTGNKEVTLSYQYTGSTDPVAPETPILSKDGKLYVVTKIDVKPTYAYGIVDFDIGGVSSTPYTGAVTEDGKGNYFTQEANPRELDRYITAYTYTLNGEPVTRNVTYGKIKDATENLDLRSYTIDTTSDSSTIYEGNGGYYIESEREIELVYLDGSSKVDASNVEERYRTSTGRTLDRYLSGVWYLMLNGKKDGKPLTETPILNMGNIMGGAANSLQHTMLAELWFNGILDENPYVELSKTGLEFFVDRDGNPKDTETSVTNLNEVYISEMFSLVGDLVDRIPSAAGGLGG